jgi:hypothetical protein
MAWVTVPGSNGVWEYDNAPVLGTLLNAAAKVQDDPNAGQVDEYYRANGTVTAGIRSFTPPGGNTQETYVKCRKVLPVGKIYSDSNANGPWSELSKNYYDYKFSQGTP